MRLECPQCGTHVVGRGGRVATCPSCGFSAPVPRSLAKTAPQAAPALPPPAPPLTRPPTRPLRPWAALVLNLVLPGAGTLAGGRRLEGAVQLCLLVLGLATIVYLVGLAIVPAVWVWALVRSILDLGDARGGGRRAAAE